MNDRELIDAYLAGELDESGLEELDERAKAHPELIGLLDGQREVHQGLDALLGPEDAGTRVTASVLARLDATPTDAFARRVIGSLQPQVAGPADRLRPTGVLVLLGVAAALMVAAALVFYSMPTTRGPRYAYGEPPRVPARREQQAPVRPGTVEADPGAESGEGAVERDAGDASGRGMQEATRGQDPASNWRGGVVQPHSQFADGGDAPAAVVEPKDEEHPAYVDVVEGDVEIRSSGFEEWRPAFPGVPIVAGDSLRTKYARSRIRFESGSKLCVNRFTTLSLHPGPAPHVRIVAGEVYVETAKRDAGFRVETPQGFAVDHGTRFGVRVKDVVGTTVVVAEGRVEAGNELGSASLGADDAVSVPSEQLAPRPVKHVDAAAVLAWTADVPGAGGRERRRRVSWRVGAEISASSDYEGYEAWRAIDGDPDTMWHSRWTGRVPRRAPHELTIALARPTKIVGVRQLPRCDRDHLNGRIDEYEIHVSADGMRWVQACAGRFENVNRRQTAYFPRAVTIRYVKLRVLSDYSHRGYGSVAELDLIQVYRRTPRSQLRSPRRGGPFVSLDDVGTW